MALLTASSGAALVSRQRSPLTLLRDEAGGERLRYHPLSCGRQWSAVASGGRPLGTILGRSGATAADQWHSSGFAAIA